MNYVFYSVQDWVEAGKPLNSFVCGDCMEGMSHIGEKEFDLAVVDPPYGINYDIIQNECSGKYRTQNGGTWKKYHQTKWDESIPDIIYFNNLKNKTINQIIWGGNFFGDYLGKTKCWIIWDKIQRDNRADAEMAWTNFDKPIKIFRYSRADAYINDCDLKIHPTQKPVKLYRWTLKNYANPGWKILDTHVGSASSLIACEIEGFEYLGFEKDRDYFDAAVERMKRERQKLKQETLIKVFDRQKVDQIELI